MSRRVQDRRFTPLTARVSVADGVLPGVPAAACRGSPRSSPSRRLAGPSVPQLTRAVSPLLVGLVVAGIAGY